MNLEQLQTCADVLGQMSENFANIPSDNKKAPEAGLYCSYVHSLIVEYAFNISRGMEPFDAMEATVRGDLEIPEAKAIVLKILAPRPTKE